MIGGQVFGLLLLQRSGTGHLSFLYSRSACPHCCISVRVESLSQGSSLSLVLFFWGFFFQKRREQDPQWRTESRTLAIWLKGRNQPAVSLSSRWRGKRLQNTASVKKVTQKCRRLAGKANPSCSSERVKKREKKTNFKDFFGNKTDWTTLTTTSLKKMSAALLFSIAAFDGCNAIGCDRIGYYTVSN